MPSADVVRPVAGAAESPGSDAPSRVPAGAGTVKCVVWDLDNTLWRGTLVEEGPVRLRDDAVELVKVLDARGVLQSIASKNDPDHALAVLEQLGMRDYFLYPQIGWTSKVTSLRTIATSLNISTDALAFVDDEVVER